MSENQTDREEIAASLEEPRSSTPAAYWLASVIALLGLACFPVLAEADSSAIQYEEELPTPTGKSTAPSHSGPSAHSSTASSGTSAPSQSGSTTPGSAGPASASAQTSRRGKGGTAHDRQLKRAGLATSNRAQASGQSDQTSSGGGSSPLVSVLVAIAALAAISIASVMVRQRRAGGAHRTRRRPTTRATAPPKRREG